MHVRFHYDVHMFCQLNRTTRRGSGCISLRIINTLFINQSVKSDADVQLNYARRVCIISRDPRDTNYAHCVYFFRKILTHPQLQGNCIPCL